MICAAYPSKPLKRPLLSPNESAGAPIRSNSDRNRSLSGVSLLSFRYRPGFTEISQPGYRPTPADSQAFMQELSRTLQQRGY